MDCSTILENTRASFRITLLAADRARIMRPLEPEKSRSWQLQEDQIALLKSMFEHDRSAARCEMASRRVIAFKHASALGNGPAHMLFDRITIQRRFRGDLYPLGDDRLDNVPPARSYEDYEVLVQRDGVPAGVEIVNVL